MRAVAERVCGGTGSPPSSPMIPNAGVTSPATFPLSLRDGRHTPTYPSGGVVTAIRSRITISANLDRHIFHDRVCTKQIATVREEMRTAIQMLAVMLLLAGCRPEPFEELRLPHTITGAEPLDFTKRGTTRSVISSTELGHGYNATVSHGLFTSDADKDLDFVEIMIEYPSENAIYVSMRKAFALKDLPPDILERRGDQIVSQTDDSIIFDLGSVTVTAELPWKH